MNATIRRPGSAVCYQWKRPETAAVRVRCGHCDQVVHAWPAGIGRFELKAHNLPPIDDIWASVRKPKPCAGVRSTAGHVLVSR